MDNYAPRMKQGKAQTTVTKKPTQNHPPTLQIAEQPDAYKRWQHADVL